ncbi:hypothetical protein LRC317 [Methanocella arvoryzae MRE50]|uniref:Uncharacterized protein n=1 Tax=Methanocella arvoryzae (strain DSM 22066 / NBRC 105507 / MRE50) TaxID=351160 RepID=Q0W8K2_METAR|nr:hypothetical protein orf28 [uncultured archaeon]CAJ35291.1 hypothetical protein LRC317 [Methanocella arvoryzae MRE50]
MKTVYKLGILLATALLAISALGLPAAHAQLTATSFGFPQIFHNAEVTSFNRDILSQIENEAINIDFGAAGLYGLGAFPTISQVSERSMYAESTSFYHSEETDAIGYPYVNVGTAYAGGLPFAGLPFAGLPFGGYGGWC